MTACPFCKLSLIVNPAYNRSFRSGYSEQCGECQFKLIFEEYKCVGTSFYLDEFFIFMNKNQDITYIRHVGVGNNLIDICEIPNTCSFPPEPEELERFIRRFPTMLTFS